MTQRFPHLALRITISVTIGTLLICHGWSAEQRQAPISEQMPPERLVHLALESEMAGNNDQREALLQQAITQSPDHAATRWHLGQVRVGNAWLSPREVQQAAENDERLANYRRLRETASPTVADQVTLARWCRKNKLVDEERVHWMMVCQLQPDHPEALKALGLHSYQGMLLTADQIASLKEQALALNKAIDRWRPLVAQWRRAAESHEPSPPTEVRNKVAETWNLIEMLGLQRALWQYVGVKRDQRQQYHSMCLELTQVLDQNPHPAAAQCLAWLAVVSESENVRDAAVEALKRHPLDHYVPLLLAGLRSPLEAAMQCTVDATGNLITHYSTYQEGPLADRSFTQMVSPVLVNDPAPIPATLAKVDVSAFQPTGSPDLVAWQTERIAEWQRNEEVNRAAWRQNEIVQAAMRQQQNLMRSRQQAMANSAALRSALDAHNRVIEQNNARIIDVLSHTTGENRGEAPRDWWKWWWQDYNDAYAFASGKERSPGDNPLNEPDGYAKKPVVEDADMVTYGVYSPALSSYTPAISPVAPRPTGATSASATSSYSYSSTTVIVGGGGPYSCFARGTKVWTQAGQLPIEQIKIGDRVLAQDVESGELAYKPVLAVTIRKPVPRLKIGLGLETLTTTLSHPFWLAGKGWQLAKELEVGANLHTLSGGQLVETIEREEPDFSGNGISYNLIVADFNTYYVGEQGILVHDNTPRRPTSVLLPGLAKP